MSDRRVSFAPLPTPCERMDRLGAELGFPPGGLLVKRDDLTALAGGGNKVRKLERLCADALDQDADTLVTGGGRQSNHVRMARSREHRKIILYANPGTEGFYARLGFLRMNTAMGFWQDPANAINTGLLSDAL